MRYLGGKKRIAKELCEFLNKYVENTDYYLEPFCGSCSIIERITHKKRYANDANIYLIEMFIALQQGWLPPKNISEEEYKRVKDNKDMDKPLTAFVGFGCGFGGKWFAGYSRDRKTDRNFALNMYNTLLKLLPNIKDVKFLSRDYKNCHPKNALIYCDPPYANTTQYDFFNGFNTEEFWNIMREWSKNNKVFISEYSAPDDFECVLEIKTRTDLKNKDGKMIPRIEKLFKYKN